ncbi:MAG: Crp/Fnr family transcriptional regulator [Cyclobacteriaceae bacterium]|jgi:CRP/FNR family transcriptional regulator|nr:Crp/Fnr family transcriptional regulator [Flammeovirgaceae bacterium]
MEVSDLFHDPKLIDGLQRFGVLKKVQAGAKVISSGDPVVFTPLVLAGSLRIMREDEEGRDVFLYHLYPGDTCAMSLTCCQSGQKSMVNAVVEEDARILFIPANQLEDWFQSAEWRQFMHTTYSNRFAELLRVIDLIAFHNFDKQILHYLQERSKAQRTRVLHITHQQIADELHTHREAVSRLLRTMETKGLVKLGRNTIEILTGL